MDVLSQKTDEELVIASLENKEVFGVLIDRYAPKLRRYVCRITNVCREDTDDLLQEIFVKVYQNLHGFDTDLKFSSWIYRIAHNVVISAHRKRVARPEGHLADIEDHVLQEIIADESVGGRVDGFDRLEIERVFAEMDVKYREVLVLRFFEEKSYDEISDIVKKPIGTVGTLVNRAKKQFAKLSHLTKEAYE